MRLALALFNIAALTFFAVLLVRGDGPGSGDVLFGVTRGHGINANDLPIVAGWAGGVAATALLYRRR